jgi:hypothetical protein
MSDDWTDNPFAAPAAPTPTKAKKIDAPPASNDEPLPAWANEPTKDAEFNPFQGQPKSIRQESAAPPPAAEKIAPPFDAAAPAAPVAAAQLPLSETAESPFFPSWASKKKEGDKSKKILAPEAQSLVTQQPTYNGDSRAADPNRTPNFPPLPKFMQCWKIRPCYYIDIAAEIPAFGRPLLRYAMINFWLYTITILWNWIAVMSALNGGTSDDLSKSCALASLYLLVAAPCGFTCWFHTLYNAVRNDSTIKFSWFFLVMFGQMAFCVIATIGFPSWGFSGFIFAGNVIGDAKIAGILCFTAAVLWLLNGLLNFWVLTTTLKFYRTTGKSYDNLHNDAATELASNKAVQKGAFEAMQSSNI